MEKKTIGAFIAALRKANGLTQQDVADRLNVSNKAVSRWERDECAPDISVIPALAELLGVSCDELLKGERIFDAPHTEKAEPKIEMQKKLLINREMTRFKTTAWIAFALALAGMVGMLCISYGFFRPVIGFSVLMLFEIAAATVTVIAVNRSNEMINSSEVFDSAGAELQGKCRATAGRLAFAVIAVIVAVVSFSLPLLLTTNGYDVITWDSYCRTFFLPIALIIVILILNTYKAGVALLSGQKLPRAGARMTKAQSFSMLQMLSLLISGALIVLSPYAQRAPGNDTTQVILNFIALLFILLDVILFVAFALKYKSERRSFLLMGSRNLCLIAPVLMLSEAHHAGFSEICEIGETVIKYERYDFWSMEWVYCSLTVALAIIAVFRLIITINSHRCEAKNTSV